MESVFKALGDPTRRVLLDRLFDQDGQSLSALSVRLDMTRFGVMKHLGVLERASLVVARKVGREKLHYLNPFPILAIRDRWISKYATRWAAPLADLKNELENQMPKPTHVFETFIQTTPEKLWQGITTPEMARRYFFGTEIHSVFSEGARFEYLETDGKLNVSGIVVEAVPFKKLVLDWNVEYDEELLKEGPTRVTFEIVENGDICKLTVIHECTNAPLTFEHVRSGWAIILSGLKTVLETGEELRLAG